MIASKRKPGNRLTGTSAGWFPDNWSDTGGVARPERALTWVR